MCEKCLYRNNCQFLVTHKKSVVANCTAFKSEADIKSEVAREIFAEIEKIIQKNYDSAQNNEEDEELEAATDYLSYVSYDIDKLKEKYEVNRE